MFLQSDKAEIKQEQFHLSILSFGSIELLMPQCDIVSIESLNELNSQYDNHLSIGSLTIQGKDIPVYCFSENMDFLIYHPADRMQCVIIKHDSALFGVVCCELTNKVLNSLCFEDVPVAMKNINMPITHLCLYKMDEVDMGLGLVTNASALNYYIDMASKNVAVP